MKKIILSTASALALFAASPAFADPGTESFVTQGGNGGVVQVDQYDHNQYSYINQEGTQETVFVDQQGFIDPTYGDNKSNIYQATVSDNPYSWGERFSTVASVQQMGEANVSYINQDAGFDQQAFVTQIGAGNQVNAHQSGAGNSLTVNQGSQIASGLSNSSNSDQTGFWNAASVTQNGSSNGSDLYQSGDFNTTTLSQKSDGNYSSINQAGGGNLVTVTQN